MLLFVTVVLLFVALPAWLAAAIVISTLAVIHVTKQDLALTLTDLVTPSKSRVSLSGVYVWVTGASSGIGEELCYQLAQQGARLVLSARREEELIRVRNACKNPTSHVVVPLDLDKHDTHEDVVKQVLAKLGPKGGVDILVNNAGRSQRALAEQTPLHVVQQQLSLNTLGTVSLTKALLPHLILRGQAYLKQKQTVVQPQIVVISSLAGKVGAPASSGYSCAKHALHGYFDTLRMELHDYGIHVNMVCPGPVVSEVGANAHTASGEAVKNTKNMPLSAYHNRRMPTAQACEAIVKSMVLRVAETWISPNPELVIVYLAQYCPLFTGLVGTAIGAARVKQFREQLTK